MLSKFCVTLALALAACGGVSVPCELTNSCSPCEPPSEPMLCDPSTGAAGTFTKCHAGDGTYWAWSDTEIVHQTEGKTTDEPALCRAELQ